MKFLGREKRNDDELKKAIASCDAIPSDKTRQQGSRRKFREATKPTKFSRTRRSAPNTTSSAMPLSAAVGRRCGGFGVLARGSIYPTPWRAFMNDFGGDNIFSDLFGMGGGGRRGGRGRSRSGGSRGNDLQVHLKLTLEEIHSGVSKTLKVRRKDTCSECKGSGSKSGKKTTCKPV